MTDLEMLESAALAAAGIGHEMTNTITLPRSVVEQALGVLESLTPETPKVLPNWLPQEARELLKCRDLIRAALEQPHGEQEPVASAKCPICGADSPHAHSKSEIKSWLVAQASRFMIDEIVILSRKDYDAPSLVHTGDCSHITNTHCLLVPADGRPAQFEAGTKFYLHPASNSLLCRPQPKC